MNEIIFLSGFLAGFILHWFLFGPKKKKVNNQEFALWEYGEPFVRCSNCGCKMNTESSYCPECGYKMLGTKRVYEEPDSIGMSREQFKQEEEKLGRAN